MIQNTFGVLFVVVLFNVIATIVVHYKTLKPSRVVKCMLILWIISGIINSSYRNDHIAFFNIVLSVYLWIVTIIYHLANRTN